MNEIDEIKSRMQKRRAQRRPTLTDHHFSKLYNAMIKSMVVLLVGLAICSYVKVSPNGEQIKKYVLNDLHFQDSVQWLGAQFNRFMLDDEPIYVSSKVSYTQVKDNYYTNQTNEVLNFERGRVIYIGEQELLGKYITVLLENNVEVTYGQLNDIFVNLYDQVDAATILGTYNEKVMIVFTQGEKEIDYGTFEELLS